MFKNIHYDKWQNVMHLWYNDEEQNCHYTTEYFVPYVFIPNSDGNINSIYGHKVSKKEFKTFEDYENFCRKNQYIIEENNVKPEIQYLTEKYFDISDSNIFTPKLKTAILDIEVNVEPRINWLLEIKTRNKNSTLESTYTIKYIEENFSDEHKENLEYYNGELNLWSKYDVERFSIDDEFPNPDDALQPVVVVSIYDDFNNIVYTWGLQKYRGFNGEVRNIYVQCKSEEELLRNVLFHLGNNCYDIITGWNNINFDILYLYNRCFNIFPEETYGTREDRNRIFDLISPIKSVRQWKSFNGWNFDAAGITIVDYMEIFKIYSKLAGLNHESYRLDNVAKKELKEGKLDYSEYINLKNLYNQNFDMYVDYNIIDVIRVKQLNDKFRYIELIQQLCLLSKVPLRYYDSVTALIEGIFLVWYRRNGYCAPTFKQNTQSSFPAAYVKAPLVGTHKWCIDIDITSSYPHQMIVCNMGNETYFGRILVQQPFDEIKNPDDFLPNEILKYRISEDDCINYTRKKEFPPIIIEINGNWQFFNNEKLKVINNSLKSGLLSIAPNGAIFKTNKPAIIATVEKELFNKRKDIQKEYFKAVEENNKEKIIQLKALETAVKRILNSIYGSLTVPYYRGFNIHIGMAITACGRHALKSGINSINEILNNYSKYDKLKTVIGEL